MAAEFISAVAVTSDSESVTVPADATAAYLFWAFWTAAGEYGLASASLNSASPGETFEIATSGENIATGVAAWYSPATGSRTLASSFDTSPTEGPVRIIAFTKGGDTTAWRDADATFSAAGPGSVTLTTVSGDLVIKFDQKYGGLPSQSASWTTGATQGPVSGEYARLSYISASGVTTACDSEDENFSTIVAIAIPEGAGGVESTIYPGRSLLVSTSDVGGYYL